MKLERCQVATASSPIEQLVLLARWPDGTAIGREIFPLQGRFGTEAIFRIIEHWVPQNEDPPTARPGVRATVTTLTLSADYSRSTEHWNDSERGRWRWFLLHTLPESARTNYSLFEIYLRYASEIPGELAYDPEPFLLLGDNGPAWWTNDDFNTWVAEQNPPWMSR